MEFRAGFLERVYRSSSKRFSKSALNRSMAFSSFSSSSPETLKVTCVPTIAANISTSMIDLASAVLPSHVMLTSISKSVATCTSLVAARTCRPSAFVITISFSSMIMLRGFSIDGPKVPAARSHVKVDSASSRCRRQIQSVDASFFSPIRIEFEPTLAQASVDKEPT